MVKLSRRFIIASVIALAALFVLGFGKPVSDNGVHAQAVAPQGIVLTAVTAAEMPTLGPIPCLDGSTVDIGQFCPIPTIQCADGTSVFVGQFCPVFKPAPPPQQAPPPPPPQQAPPPPPPQGQAQQKCKELGTC